jgi:hypothetical protein
MAAELADAASCSSDTTAPDPVPAALDARTANVERVVLNIEQDICKLELGYVQT